MTSSLRNRFHSSSSSSSSSTTVTYALPNEHITSQPQSKTTQIPIYSDPAPIPITVSFPTHKSSPPPSLAAVKIQSSYRSHRVRTLVKKIASINSEATRIERLIQRQETVDAIRSDGRERIAMNESLMRLLLDLDSVPGIDPGVRDLRRHASRRIVGLQEILDCVCDAKVENWEEIVEKWEDVMAEMEVDVCREKGGDELERFCAENLGFRCLQRFLRY